MAKEASETTHRVSAAVISPLTELRMAASLAPTLFNLPRTNALFADSIWLVPKQFPWNNTVVRLNKAAGVATRTQKSLRTELQTFVDRRHNDGPVVDTMCKSW